VSVARPARPFHFNAVGWPIKIGLGLGSPLFLGRALAVEDRSGRLKKQISRPPGELPAFGRHCGVDGSLLVRRDRHTQMDGLSLGWILLWSRHVNIFS
jgi:hypothetical protein